MNTTTNKERSNERSNEKLNYAKGERSGFSLVELLVVVMILVILVALLWPAAKGTLQASLAAKCTANLRAIGVAAHLNAADHDGKWVLVDELNGMATWDDILLKGGYLNASNVVYCPAWKPKTYHQWQTYGANWMGLANSPDDYIHASYNFDAVFHVTYFTLNLKAISKSSQYILLGDSYTTRPGLDGSQYYILQGRGILEELHLRHSKRANILFADGHVGATATNQLREIGWRFAYDLKGQILEF